MVRWFTAALLALFLTFRVLPAAAAMFEAEEQTLTQEIEKGGLTGTALAKDYMARGSLRLLNQQMADALADYDQGVATAPKLAQAYLHRAIGRREAGDLAHAVDDLSQAIALGADDPAGAHYLRGDLRARLKDYRAAIADYDQAIALDKEFGHAYVGRGNARLEAGDETGALADASHAVQSKSVLYEYKNLFRLIPHYEVLFPRLHMVPIDPSHPLEEAYLLRGRLLLQKGDYQHARSDFQYVIGQGIKKPELWLYYSLDLLAIHHCWDGEDMLDEAAEAMGTSRATLVQAHRDFIAKTPCAEDLLE
jgi:tetratricopeptide (TPR) repeat protein